MQREGVTPGRGAYGLFFIVSFTSTITITSTKFLLTFFPRGELMRSH